jgi:hypothetical protein
MSRFDDYTSEMPATLDDHAVDQLLSRATDVPDDLADLKKFVSVMSAGTKAPRDVSHMATSLAATARASASPRRGGFRRLAILTASMAILFAFSGIAMAANSAVPGDTLYTFDGLLEKVGIGAGGVDERIDEFDELRERGSETAAYQFLGEYIGSAEEEESLIASEHLIMVATDGAVEAAEAAEKVLLLKEFIEDNMGHGVGLDGRDFGLGIAAIARGSVVEPGGPNGGPVPGGPGQGAIEPPANQGPPDHRGPVSPDNDGDNQGQQGSGEEPGQSGDPGPPDDRGSSQENTPGENPGGDAPGATSPGKSGSP